MDFRYRKYYKVKWDGFSQNYRIGILKTMYPKIKIHHKTYEDYKGYILISCLLKDVNGVKYEINKAVRADNTALRVK